LLRQGEGEAEFVSKLNPTGLIGERPGVLGTPMSINRECAKRVS
jgi:hypothetical protein